MQLDAFRSDNTLQPQARTCFAIGHYVSGMFWGHERCQRTSEGEANPSFRINLTDCHEANGVFLWVNLVVSSLSSGIRNHDSIKDLQRRVDLSSGGSL